MTLFLLGWTVARHYLGIRPYPGPSQDEFKGRTERPSPDHYQTEPSESSYEQRRQEYLQLCADRGEDYWNGTAALQLGRVQIPNASLQEALDRVEERKDCADFRAARLVRLLGINRRQGLLEGVLEERIANTLKGFKFWKDQGGEDSMIMETENHQILFHSCEYLMGQWYPHDVFPNDGKSGEWHREHARMYILNWMDRKIRFGFCEWDSNVYFNETIPGLANIAEFAEEEYVAQKAIMLLDLLLFDMAVDLHKGVYGTSHGRSYEKEIRSGRDDHLRGLVWLVFGLGDPTAIGNFAGICMATSDRYVPPLAIQEAGRRRPEVFVNRERHGFPLAEAEALGFSFTDPKNMVVFWEMGAYSQPQVISMSMRMVEEWSCWNQPFFKDIASLRGPVNLGNRLGLLPLLARYPWIKSHMTLLGEAHKITYRTPDYMLSTAQDYRPGEMGNQHHIWQATLDQDAIVYVTHPGSLRQEGMTPTYWGGQCRFPRSCQVGPVHISLYRLGRMAALGEPVLYSFTHAYFPGWAFDEVREEREWVFGRRERGYVALRSSGLMRWTTEGRDAGHEIVVEGRNTQWICQCGSETEYGSFDAFVEAISSSRIDFEKNRVLYDAPQVGRLVFPWKGPLTWNERPVDLKSYPRFDNPYCTAAFGSHLYRIQVGEHLLVLDFQKGERIEGMEKVEGAD